VAATYPVNLPPSANPPQFYRFARPAACAWKLSPVSKTSNFTAYTIDGFKYVDQLRLGQYAVWLRDCGAHVILSQSADEILIDQYRRCGFKCDKVQARRNVNSKGGKRGPVGEYIIYGGK